MKAVCLSFLLFLGLTTSLPAKTLDTCFSPLGHCDQVMISWINSSLKTLDGAIYGLTDENIAQALIRAHERGVQIRLVHDKTQSAGKHDVSEELLKAGIPVHIQRGSEGGILHDKFLIIDSKYVLTGSFNWTDNATEKNDENFVVLDDEASKFQPEFDRLWNLPETLTAPPAPKTHTTRSHVPKVLVMPLIAPVPVSGPVNAPPPSTSSTTTPKHPRKRKHHKKKLKPATETTPSTFPAPSPLSTNP